MPREGLKPGAVVEEGGKRRAGETPLDRAGGVWSQGWPANPHQDPQAPPVPSLSWQSGPGCIPWQPLGEGAARRGAEGPVSSASPPWPQLDLSRPSPAPHCGLLCGDSCGFLIPFALWSWGPGCAIQSCPLA